jgi:hypothetical protein
MPFKPGDPKPANSGRGKNSKNADTQWAIDLANSKKKHPFEILLDFANRDHEALGLVEFKEMRTKTGETYLEATISPELQQKSAKDACEFILSKLRAIDHSADGGEALFGKLMQLVGQSDS